MRWDDGSEYCGDWKNHTREGKGEMKWNNGCEY